MAQSGTRNLRLYTERPGQLSGPRIEASGSFAEALLAFRRATGWSLRYLSGPQPDQADGLMWSAPVSPGDGATLGHLRLEPLGSDKGLGRRPAVNWDTAQAMASALAGVLGELVQTRHALRQREAELAAGAPVAPHADEEQHLAARLEAVLKGGAEAVGCHAAALYLLDEATTELKLRSCWGLPFDRLAGPARPLRGAIADLEALLGHAVVLEDAATMQSWNIPEDFPGAVCVPVSTPTTILGTLWAYSKAKREFTSQQTNILEVVAGRLAADLERAMLLHEGVEGARLKKQVAAAQRLQRNQLPTISPLLDGWQLAGWTQQADAIGGDYYDWFCLPEGLLAVVVGDAVEQGLAAGMAANTVKAAIRAHGQYHRQAERILKQVNLTLWTGSAGDQRAAVFFGLIETATGRMAYSVAGQPGIVAVRQDGWELLSQSCPPLGSGPETDYGSLGYELEPGEALVVFSQGIRDAPDCQGRPLGEAGVAEPLVGHLDLPADRLVDVVRKTWKDHTEGSPRDDCTVLVAKRTQA